MLTISFYKKVVQKKLQNRAHINEDADKIDECISAKIFCAGRNWKILHTEYV
jgi:hypothetical protein